MALEIMLLGSAGLATALAGIGCAVLSRDIAQFGKVLRRREAQLAEARRLDQAQRDLAAAQNLAETAIAGGTELVRTVHKSIADIPFAILESISVTRDTTRVVRRTHDLIADAAYGTVGAVNKGVGMLLRRGLSLESTPSKHDRDPAPAGDKLEP